MQMVGWIPRKGMEQHWGATFFEGMIMSVAAPCPKKDWPSGGSFHCTNTPQGRHMSPVQDFVSLNPANPKC